MTGALRIDGGELPSTAGVRAPRTRLLTGWPLRPARHHPRPGGTSRSTAPTRAEDRAGGDGGQPRRLARRAAARDLRAAAGARADQAGDVRRDARPLPARPRADRARPLPRRRAPRSASRCKSLRRRARRRGLPRGRARARRHGLARAPGRRTWPWSPARRSCRWRSSGTRLPGGADGSLPPRGTRLAMTFGEPVDLGSQPVAAHPAGHGRRGRSASPTRSCRPSARPRRATGMTLPGPLGPKREKKREHA